MCAHRTHTFPTTLDLHALQSECEYSGGNAETRRPPRSGRRFTATRILIATVLVFFCQFSGYTIVSFYATAILRMDSSAGSDTNSTGNLFRYRGKHNSVSRHLATPKL